MTPPRILVFLVGLLLVLPACTTTRPYVDDLHENWKEHAPASELVYRVFLIGDAGGIAPDQPLPTLTLLQRRLEAAGENAAVIFLGGNAYPAGLSDSTNLSQRLDAERRLQRQLDVIENFAGRVLFLPGHRDWNDSEPGGLAALARQERFIEDALDRGNTFLPDEGFPGPVKVDLHDDVRLIVLDTEWWLYEHQKSFGDTGDYDLEEDANFLIQLDDLLKRSRGDNVLVVGHHPLRSNGRYGGRLPARDHLFPLTNIHPALVLPLPIVGSAYPLYVRYLGGSRQDLGHPRYQALREALTQTFYQHANLIYASGHDNSLQFFEDHFLADFPQYHLISGSGSRSVPVGRGREAVFSYGGQGFSTLGYYEDGSVWMEMWRPSDDGADGELLFRQQIQEPARDRVDPGVPTTVEVPYYSDSTVVEAAGERYAAGPVKTFFLGSHNRQTWATPVELPVLDIGTEAGGLTPLQRGGGHQTLSLRFENDEGQQYVIRTLDKDPSGTVPINLQGTVATDIVQDQIALIQPYGAVIIPPLADAIGVYHTNPKTVYIPDDPRLGIYAETFAGKVALFEERPTGDMSHQPSFGNSRDVVSAHRFYREMNADNDHRVDAHAFARARLFDMLLSDWDRHVDQWRWASFEPYELNPSLEGEARKEGKIYRPIPRDRDFAFNQMTGFLFVFASQFDPRYQDFTENYGSLKGLAWSSLPQDHRLVSPLERQDWINIADSIRAGLTDEVIDAAVRQWPEAVYAIKGEETARYLKIRRDKLTEVAEDFYEIHASVPDIVGSNKHERFEVTRTDNDSTRVVVYKTSKKGEIRREIYRRTFLEDETREIRLYGLDGNDTFVVEGDVGKGIKIRAIGGAGEDTFIDHARVHGVRRLSHFYDTETGNTWDVGDEAKLTRSDDDPSVNFYTPQGFQYNLTKAQFFFGSNEDDGIFIGGGPHFIRQGFRKIPYGASHKIKANIATRTQAVNAVYEGHYVDVFGAWDVLFDAEYFSPNNIRNFYGLGNETENEENDREFYQARLTQARVAPSLYKSTERGAALRLGTFFQWTNVDETADRFVNQPQAGVSANTFDIQTFIGIDLETTVDARDNLFNPTQGFAWTNLAQFNVGLGNVEDTYLRLSTDLAFYLSPSISPQVTLAGRIGAAHNVGDFPFYSAVTLGGKENLRGFRSTRFAGRTNFYQNVELRLQLFTFSTLLAVGKAGILGFLDNGRVWTDGESSDVWHQGYGGGLWFELFDALALSAALGSSNDDQTFTLKFGFQY